MVQPPKGSSGVESGAVWNESVEDEVRVESSVRSENVSEGEGVEGRETETGEEA